MVAPVIVAAGIGAAGAIGGGLLSKKKAGPGVFTTLKRQADFADKYGLHRLSVIGSNPGYGGVSSPDILGQSITEGANALAGGIEAAGAAKRDKKLDQIAAEQLELQKLRTAAEVAEARSRTLFNEANTKKLIEGPTPSVNGTHGGIEGLTRGGTLDGRTIVQEPARDLAARQKVTLGNRTAIGPNPEAFEVGLSELIAGTLVYGPQWAAQALREANRELIAKQPSRPKGQSIRY